MYIREIHIENVRGFDEVHLDLDRGGGKYAGWTVVAGRNGTGKSTLLKAIALSVAGVTTAGRLQKSFADWIRDGQDKAVVKTLLDTRLYEWIAEPDDQPLSSWTAIEWRRESGPEPLMNEAADVELLLPGLVGERGPWSSNPTGWFLAGYGPFRRFGHRDDYKEPGPEMAARLASLFDEDATVAEAIHWLKDIHARRLDLWEKARKKRDRQPVTELEDEAHALGGVHDSVLDLLNDDLLPPGARIVDFDMSGLWIEQNGVRLALRNLSDGYRSAIALVFDIVRQMDRCFGSFRIESSGKSVVVPYEGIVLIDEIDAHLHPEWQQQIGFWLKAHFPKIQFIVTTHSPFICQAADPQGLIRLRAPGDSRPTAHVPKDLYYRIVNGSADEAVVTELFGLGHAHSGHSEALRERASTLEGLVIHGKANAKQKAELKRVEAQLPGTMSADVERALNRLTARLGTGKTGTRR